MDVMVRRASAEDAPALARMRWRWRVEESKATVHTDREWFVDFFTQWVLDHLATGSLVRRGVGVTLRFRGHANRCRQPLKIDF